MAPTPPPPQQTLPADPPPPTNHAVAPSTQADGEWRRRHHLSPLVNSVDLVTRGLPFLIIAILQGPDRGVLILAAMVVATLVYTVVAHFRFTYCLEDDRLTVRSGVITQQQRTIPADRVQQVSLDRKIRHLIFGVAEVSVESAGAGAEPEVKLSALSIDEAERFRAVLSAGRQRSPGDSTHTPGGEATPPAPVDSHEVYRQPNAALWRMAIASGPLMALPLVGAAVAFGAQSGADLPGDSLATRTLVVLGVLAFVLAVLAAIAITVVRYYDLRIERTGPDLRVRYGLLTQRQADVPRDRVQVLVEGRSVPARLVGVLAIEAHNASASSEGTTTALPAVPSADRGLVISELLPGLDLDAAIVRHPRAALRRALIRRLVPTALIAAGVVVLVDPPWRWAILLLPAAALVFGLRAWLVLGHGETPDVVAGRSGVWAESTAHIRRDRIQSASVSANGFQRRAGLATLRVDVAQPLGRVTIIDLEAAEAARLLKTLTRPQRAWSTNRTTPTSGSDPGSDPTTPH